MKVMMHRNSNLETISCLLVQTDAEEVEDLEVSPLGTYFLERRQQAFRGISSFRKSKVID